MADLIIVDDDRAIREGKAHFFTLAGHRVRTARSAAEALAAYREARPDLILLDVNMPREDGFSACRTLRALDAKLPLLFLTALDDERSKLEGFASGADDYICKAVSDAELLARVNRILVRTAVLSEADEGPRQIDLDGVIVDFDAQTVEWSGVAERLTKTEADFLWLLASERGKFFSTDEIIDVLRGRASELTPRAVITHVCRLKRKLGPAERFLANSRGSGYALTR